VGAGDGWYAAEMTSRNLAMSIRALEVHVRPRSKVDVELYDGENIPMPDRSVELAYAIDVLHHCREPMVVLREMMRCTEKFLLLKDHTFESQFDRWVLACLDIVGNRSAGIPSAHGYQHRWEWVERIEAEGFERRSLLTPVSLARGPVGLVSNKLQFIGLWQRTA
jgi:ubiquinone/menaquinone biosynthesis C-methylase UbiE